MAAETSRAAGADELSCAPGNPRGAPQILTHEATPARLGRHHGARSAGSRPSVHRGRTSALPWSAGLTGAGHHRRGPRTGRAHIPLRFGRPADLPGETGRRSTPWWTRRRRRTTCASTRSARSRRPHGSRARPGGAYHLQRGVHRSDVRQSPLGHRGRPAAPSPRQRIGGGGAAGHPGHPADGWLAPVLTGGCCCGTRRSRTLRSSSGPTTTG
jgi:hypothetical protein